MGLALDGSDPWRFEIYEYSYYNTLSPVHKLLVHGDQHKVTITHDGRFCAICGHPGQSLSFLSIYLDATNAHSRPNTEADRHSVGERAWGFTLWPISRRDTNGGYCLHGGQACLALSQPWSKGRSSHGIPASEAVIVTIQSKGVAHRCVWGVWEGVSLRR